MTEGAGDFIALYRSGSANVQQLVDAAASNHSLESSLEWVLNHSSAITHNIDYFFRVELVQALLKRGANPNHVHPNNGATLLQNVIMYSSTYISKPIARALIEAKAGVDFQGFSSCGRPLILCVKSNHADGVAIGRLLLENDAGPITQREKEVHNLASHLLYTHWYWVFIRSMRLSWLATRATERALTKTRLLHKDVIPLIGQHVWATRFDDDIWN